MSIINITNICIQNNPSQCETPITLNITFECIKALPEEIEWELIYIGSAKDDKYDQVLDSFTMGPLDQGIMTFTLQSNAADFSKIPSKYDILGVTALILKVSYRKQEFVRVGYYVINQYTDLELIELDPEVVPLDQVQRQILHDKPRITHFNIKWDDSEQVNNPEETQQKIEGGSITEQKDTHMNRESYLDQFQLGEKNSLMMEKQNSLSSSDQFIESVNKFADLSSNAAKQFFRPPAADASAFFG